MLSKYISESEFTITQVRGIDNSLPKGAITKNATILCEEYLDVIRAFYGKPLMITSGYRCPSINEKVGGSMNPPSKHMGGNAADIHIVGISVQQLFNDIAMGVIKSPDGKPLMNKIDQIIFENPSNPWLHIQRCNIKPRRLKMRAIFIKGKAIYQNVTSI